MSIVLPEEALEFLIRLTTYQANRRTLTRARCDPYSLFNYMAIAGLCDMIECIPRVLLPKNAVSYRQFLSGRASLRTTIAAWMRNEPVTFDVIAGKAKRYPLWLIRHSLDTAIEERRERYRRASVSFAAAPSPCPGNRTAEIVVHTAVIPHCDGAYRNLTFRTREDGKMVSRGERGQTNPSLSQGYDQAFCDVTRNEASVIKR